MMIPPQLLDREPSDQIVVRGDSRAFAWFTACGRYRYILGRSWNPNAKPMAVCMLNPSTADERVVDPTVRKCIHFAQRDGYGAIIVVNLYALRATDPKFLKIGHERKEDVVGRFNDAVLGQLSKLDTAIAAWGAPKWAFVEERIAQVRAMHPKWQCLGRSKDGHPRHPLYLPNDAAVSPWSSP